jgi:hypothetical protein
MSPVEVSFRLQDLHGEPPTSKNGISRHHSPEASRWFSRAWEQRWVRFPSWGPALVQELPLLGGGRPRPKGLHVPLPE